MVGNRNLSVGIFVSAALAILIIFTVWITGRTGSEPTQDYSILIADDVSGLMLGGPVFFLGVGVGEVTSLSIVEEGPQGSVAVRVEIEVLATTPIKEHTWATLAAQGITGVSVINLSNAKDQTGRQDGNLDKIELPMIPYKDSGFSAIMSSAPGILNKIETLLSQASELLGEANQQSLQQALDNIESITGSLASQEEAFPQLLSSMELTLGEVRTTLDQVQGLLDEAGPDVVSTMDNLDQAVQSLAGASERLDAWFEASDGEMLAFFGDGLGQVPALVEDARVAIRELEKLLEDLRANPSGVVYKQEEDAVKTDSDD